MNKKYLGYIASVLFLIPCISTVISLFSGNSSLWDGVSLIGSLLIIVSCITIMPVLLIAGAVIIIISSIPGFISNITAARFMIPNFARVNGTIIILGATILPSIFSLISDVFMILIGVLRNKAKMNGLISGGIRFCGFIVLVLASSSLNRMMNQIVINIQPTAILLWISIIAARVLLGFVFYKENDNKDNLVFDDEKSIIAAETQIERVSQLKELFDKGIINQEEFEEKKARILNP